MAYDTKHVGEVYGVNLPRRENWSKLTLDEGKELASTHRWIYANASCKDLYEAKDEATKLSNAIGSPMVLVYMPKDIMDGTRNEYPGNFHASMRTLIERALADRKELLITARSYGVHQALRAVRSFDTPIILLIGIAPAFGAFGNVFSDNVKQYIKDVKHTRCRYFMIASQEDGHTWRAGGAAARKEGGRYRGHDKVGEAMDRNKTNVDYCVIRGADHYPIDEYLRHGLVDAMKKGVHHWGLDNTPIGDIINGRPIRVADGADAQSVLKKVRAKWEALGGAQGFLKNPETNLKETPDREGFYMHFEGGSIYWHPETGAFEVHGAIRRKWKELGWEKSSLGYPTSDEKPTPDGAGRMSRFQAGVIYWTRDRGAWVENRTD